MRRCNVIVPCGRQIAGVAVRRKVLFAALLLSTVVMLTLAARQCDAQVALALVHCPRKLACIPM